MMHGAYTAQEALKAGVLDSIELQLRPFLLGQGRRLFDRLPAEHVDLELVRTLEAPAPSICATTYGDEDEDPPRRTAGRDRERSVAFYTALGYEVVGDVCRRPSSAS